MRTQLITPIVAFQSCFSMIIHYISAQFQHMGTALIYRVIFTYQPSQHDCWHQAALSSATHVWQWNRHLLSVWLNELFFMFCTMIMLSCNITEKFCFCNLNKFLTLLKPGTDCSLSVLTHFFLVSCPFLSLSNVPSPSLSCVALDPLNWRFMKRL